MNGGLPSARQLQRKFELRMTRITRMGKCNEGKGRAGALRRPIEPSKVRRLCLRADAAARRPYPLSLNPCRFALSPVKKNRFQGFASKPPHGKWAAFQSIAIRIRARPLG
jgi:hypothetical protein